MFHIIYKILKSLIIPVIFIIVEIKIRRKKQQKYQLIDLSCKWFLFWAIGFGGLSAGLMQTFNPTYTANLLNVQTNDMIIIRELGLLQFAVGLTGMLSIKFPYFRKPAAISYGVFILGAAILHIARLGTINIEEIVSLLDDIWIVAVAVLVVFQKNRITCGTCTK